MKKIILITTLSLMSTLGFSQQVILDKSKLFHLKGNDSIDADIKIEKLPDGNYKTVINKDKGFILKSFEYEIFLFKFQEKFKEATKKELDTSNNEIKLLFYDALLNSYVHTTPNAGKMIMHDHVLLGYIVKVITKGNKDSIELYISTTELDYMSKKLQRKKQDKYRIRKKDVILNFANNFNKNKDLNWKKGVKCDGSFLKYDRFWDCVKLRKCSDTNSTWRITEVDSLYLSVEDIDMEICDGYIENISVDGTIYKGNNTSLLVPNIAVLSDTLSKVKDKVKSLEQPKLDTLLDTLISFKKDDKYDLKIVNSTLLEFDNLLQLEDTITRKLSSVLDSLISFDKKEKYDYKTFHKRLLKFGELLQKDETIANKLNSALDTLKQVSLKKSKVDKTKLDSLLKLYNLLSKKQKDYKTKVKISNEVRLVIKQYLPNNRPSATNTDVYCFTNNIPIGISAKHSMERKTKKDIVSTHYRYNNNREFIISARLCDVITYEPNLAINSRNYAPANGIYELDRKNNSEYLKKEKFQNLFDATIFTDLNAFGEKKETGIIQTEISKTISINTNRRSFNDKRSTNTGWFQYIKPFVLLRQVENGGNTLELKTIGSDTTKLGTNLINLYKNERFRLGSDLNLFVLDAPQNKLNLWLDLGAEFGQVKYNNASEVKNSKDNDSIANSLYYYTKFKCKFYPDERYGVEFSYNIGHYDIYSNQLENSNNSDSKKDDFYWLHGFEMQAFVKTGDKGKMFFKYKISSSIDNWGNNFEQILLGYSMDITRQIKTK